MKPVDAARLLDEAAVLLELDGENPFRVRAYTTASEALLPSDSLSDFLDQARSKKIKGVGPGLIETVVQILEQGSFDLLDELRNRYPADFRAMLQIPGLGAKKLQVLFREHNIRNLQELEAACLDGSLLKVKGFGQKSIEQILQGVKIIKQAHGKCLLGKAKQVAQEIVDSLSPFCNHISIAGKLRRVNTIIEELSMVASTDNPSALLDRAAELPNIEIILERTDSMLRAGLDIGLQFSLTVETDSYFPQLLLFQTGNEEHLAQLNHIAKSKGHDFAPNNKRYLDPSLVKTEQDLYRLLGLSFIPPTLREGRDEIERAELAFNQGQALPKLIELSDIKGIIHAHSTYSDGKNSLAELGEYCKQAGFEYLGITDHSQSAAYAGGLSPAAILKQHREIDLLNTSLSPFHIFKGIESDILKDGSLDYDNEVLAAFDFVVASVHSRFSLDQVAMTKRLIKAIQNPFTTILGHPSGRLLLKREPYAVDIGAVLKAAAESNVIIEINSDPRRLDLDWQFIEQALSLGVKLAITPDAHRTTGIWNIEFGVGLAQKAWVTKADVINCLTCEEIQRLFLKLRSSG